MTNSAVTTTTTTQKPTSTTAATTQSSAPTGGSSSDSTDSEGLSPTPGDGETTSPGTGAGGGSSSGESESQPEPPTLNQPGKEEPPELPGDGQSGDGDSAQGGCEENSGTDCPHDTGLSSNGAEIPGQQQQPQQTDHQSVQPQLGHTDQVLPHDDGVHRHVSTEPSDPAHEQVPPTEGKLQSSQPPGQTASQGAPVGNSDPNSVGRDAPPRLRRLSHADDSVVKYMTIVVHSAAWGFAASSYSVAIISMTTALLSGV
ncbi:UNVERIFIED_CONTAM: toxoplasma gondii family A protein, putative [Hammondia hammondi]|eukprot:XP_008884386.1 toxoplasma gondii family A protein, putative [Hammondia hammondi]